MKIKEGYVIRTIVDKTIVIPVGEQAIHFNGIITLNKSGKTLFEALQKGATKEQLLELLLDRYDVSKEQASQDIDEFVDILKSKNLLE